MGKRGPKKEPTALKRFKGNPSHETLPNEVQPKGKAVMPEWLSDHARQYWDEIATAIEPIGLLTSVDTGALSHLCDQMALYQQARQDIEEEGYYYVSDKGNQISHPSVGLLYKADAAIRSYMREFGLTPSARSGLNVSTDSADDPLNVFKQDVA